jgi:hypothetical protein
MFKALFAALLSVTLLSAAPLAAANCTGRDLLAEMPAAERERLAGIAAAEPFASGNHWLAERPGSRIHVIGTFHLFDARMPGHMRGGPSCCSSPARRCPNG